MASPIYSHVRNRTHADMNGTHSYMASPYGHVRNWAYKAIYGHTRRNHICPHVPNF